MRYAEQKTQDSGTAGLSVFFGAVLILAALGLLLVPSAAGDSAVQLVKLLVVSVAGLSGLALVLRGISQEALP